MGSLKETFVDRTGISAESYEAFKALTIGFTIGALGIISNATVMYNYPDLHPLLLDGMLAVQISAELVGIFFISKSIIHCVLSGYDARHNQQN